jgi:hypothetical protein
MNLIRQAALVAGLLTGVFYTVADHVESRRPLLAAPQIEDAGVAEQACEGGHEAEQLELESDCFTKQDRANLRKILAAGQA